MTVWYLLDDCFTGNVLHYVTVEHYHVFVGDLSPDIDSHHLREAFAPFGAISYVVLCNNFANLGIIVTTGVSFNGKYINVCC
jgi:RNA recognition motif-containing protein